MPQGEERLRLSGLRLEVARALQHLACRGTTFQQLVVGALEDDSATIDARAGTEVNDMVGHANHLLMVLYKKYGVARITQPLDGTLHQLDIVIVETRAGFVEDIQHIGERGVDVLGNLATLRLATRERSHTTIQAEIAQPNLLERREPCANSRLQVGGQRVGDGTDPAIKFCDAQRASLSDVHSVYLTRKHTLAQSRAATVRTRAHAQHRVQHGGMQQTFLGVDDGTIHTRYQTLIFRRLRPVGRRVLQPDLRTVQEQVELLGRVVLDFLVEVEESAMGIANPAPATLAERDVVDGVLVVQALVEVHELVNV